MQLLLTSIDHCNISLSIITSMIHHTGMEIFDHFGHCRISYTVSILGTLKISDTSYMIFLKIVRYEPDTDIITALFMTLLPANEDSSRNL